MKKAPPSLSPSLRAHHAAAARALDGRTTGWIRVCVDGAWQHRGRGVGRDMLCYVQEHALPMHAPEAGELRLHVLESNGAGRRCVTLRRWWWRLPPHPLPRPHQPPPPPFHSISSFYERMGLEVVARKEDYPAPGRTAIRMAKLVCARSR